MPISFIPSPPLFNKNKKSACRLMAFASGHIREESEQTSKRRSGNGRGRTPLSWGFLTLTAFFPYSFIIIIRFFTDAKCQFSRLLFHIFALSSAAAATEKAKEANGAKRQNNNNNNRPRRRTDGGNWQH
jgi:hypothetical protein